MKAWVVCIGVWGVGGCGFSESRLQIVGGETVSPAEAARLGVVGLVAARDGVRRGYCSGTLIAPDAVLTAVHCRVTPRGPVTSVVFSTEIFADQSNFVDVKSFEPIGVADLAIVWLKSSAPAPYRPAAFPDRFTVALPDSTPLTAMGFGRQATSVATSGGPLKSLSVLPANLGPGVPIFVVRSPVGSGPCFGDSGGPIFLRAGESESRLLGVLSNGTPECEAGGNTYVAVPYYASEIRLRLARGAMGDHR